MQPEIRNIENRPEELLDIPYYQGLPNLPIQIDFVGSIGEFFSLELAFLDGIQPLEERHMVANNGVIETNPSENSIEIYKKEKTQFQLIHVVINCYGFEKVHGEIIGKPYNISLQPASKRGQIEIVTSEWLENIDLKEIDRIPRLYNAFNPFLGAFGLFMMGGTVNYSGIESDMIGFVHGMFALSMSPNHHEILAPSSELFRQNRQVQNDYRKYRKKRYFKPFKKVKPRRIWGCDSPIELFMLQALNSIGLNPELQTIICEDGFTAPNFHALWENQKSRKRIKMVTEADFFFSKQKLAVFCDSIAHHSSEKNRKKDALIDEKLKNIGIYSLRICGRDIAKSPMKCANIVANKIMELT